jgi:hypothetical protein
MRRAFVVGSNGPASYGPLHYAAADADRMTGALAGLRCGFDVLPRDRYSTAEEVMRAFRRAIEECREGDTFVGYFSGHGLLERGSLLLLWDDSDTSKPLTSTLHMSAIMDAFRYCEASNKLMILDCCHAGAAVGNAPFKGGVEMKEVIVPADNMLLLLASGRLERARELASLQGSFLTTAIISAVGDDFAIADKDNDYRLSIDDLMSYLQEKAVSHNQASAETKVPFPYIFGQKKGTFYLTATEHDWNPYHLQLPDGTEVVILPVAPMPAFTRRGRKDSVLQRVQNAITGNVSDEEMVVGIGRHPVTNGQYQAFLRENASLAAPVGEVFVRDRGGSDGSSGEWKGPFSPWDDPRYSDPDQPVVCVSFLDAARYCRWVRDCCSKQYQHCFVTVPPYRLWDFAAFGTEYPSRAIGSWMHLSEQVHHKADRPAVIDKAGVRRNARGVSDLIGNVWEWTGVSGWGFLDYPSDDDQFVAAFQNRLSWRTRLAGGGFFDDMFRVEPWLRASELPHEGETRHSDLGFRLAVKLPITYLPAEVQQQVRLCKGVEWERDLDPRAALEGGRAGRLV